MRLRIKEVAATKLLNIEELAARCGVTKQAFYVRMKKGFTNNQISEIAAILNCVPYELIEPPKEFRFIYDENGKFAGIVKID